MFKQLDVEGNMLVATDKDNNVFYKIGYSKDLKGKFMEIKHFRILFPEITLNEAVKPGLG